MRLEELSDEQAYTLAREYAQTLLDAGVTVWSSQQETIYVGLFYYAVMQEAIFEMRYGDEESRNRGSSVIRHNASLVRKCLPTVNKWLALGQPLEHFSMPLDPGTVTFQPGDRF